MWFVCAIDLLMENANENNHQFFFKDGSCYGFWVIDCDGGIDVIGIG